MLLASFVLPKWRAVVLVLARVPLGQLGFVDQQSTSAFRSTTADTSQVIMRPLGEPVQAPLGVRGLHPIRSNQ